jgi:glutathione S-transferase
MKEPPPMKLYVTYGSPYARLARMVVVEKGLEGRVGDLTNGRPQLAAWMHRMSDLPAMRATALP